MNEFEFSDLVKRVETLARERPATYRRRVLLLALLGYAVLGSALLLALGLGALALILVIKAPALIKLVIKLIWIPVVLIAFLAKAMLARSPAPAGRRITRREAPKLFAEIDSLVRNAGAGRMHEVLLLTDFNAFAAEIPRFGPFFTRRYLGLGLPLLLALSEAELRAVIAHELGHFSARDGRTGAFIYRLRLLWMRLLEQADLGILRRFMAWYAPWFNAYTFVLAREQEYAADQHSARTVGAREAASALTRTAVLGMHLGENFYGQLGRRAAEIAEPPAGLMREIAQTVGQRDGLGRVLARAVRERTGYGDTHPALVDRLRALGQSPRLEAVHLSAGEAWLGDALPALLDEADESLRAELGDGWRAHYLQSASEREAAAELESRTERSAEEEYQLLRLRWRNREDEPGFAQELDALVQRAPCAPALFVWGQMQLARAPERAIEALERARDLDPEARLGVASVLSEHFWERGERERAQPYIEELESARRAAEHDMQGRQKLPEAASLTAPELAEELRTALLATARSVGKLGRVTVARVRIEDSAGPPHYLVAVRLKGMVLDEGALLGRFVDAAQLDGTMLVYAEKNLPRAQRKAMEAVGERLDI